MQEKNIIRHAGAEDEMKIRNLWKECFPGDEDEFIEYYFRERTEPENALIVCDSTSVISMLQAIPMRFMLRGSAGEGDRVIPVRFIAGVGTGTEHRGRGLTKKLLAAACSETPGEALMLSPANEKYYISSGFVTCSHRVMHRVSRDEFIKGYTDISAEGASEPTAGELLRIYNGFMGVGEGKDSAPMPKKTLFALRDEESFTAILKEFSLPDTVKKANSGAYALGYREEDGIRFNEFAYTSEEKAIELILSLFAEADTLIIPLPQGDELLGDDGETEPQNMLCLNGGSIAGFDSAASYTEAVKKCGIVPYSFELY